ncbi:hypothetical protein U3A55_04965 [Salarchaeum sp. III]|uniref:hypothetical protein n=1 Tax=Salarchaeum sp. III TaxID=3107927 RepID=UPI002EDA104E
MSWGTTRTWKYLGKNTVTRDNVGRIVIPQRVFELGVLDQPPDDQEASDETVTGHWSFDSEKGWLILSDSELTNDPPVVQDGVAQDDRFKTQREIVSRGPEDGYRMTIPSMFFAESAGGNAAVSDHVPERARVEPGEIRHFITAEEFLADTPTATKSCYLIRRSQLEHIMSSNGEEFDDAYPVPRLDS